MFVSVIFLNAIYLDKSLNSAKSSEVLEIHWAASMGSLALHRRLYHAGSRRIQLWQRRRFHLKYMPGLRSSVSNRLSPKPLSANSQSAHLRISKLYHTRKDTVLCPLPFPNPPGPRHYHLWRHIRCCRSPQRQWGLIQFKCHSLREQTEHGKESS